ncbi:MAG: NTP transferase domain-containing protein [Candidatus Methylomirabilis oxyfera]|nr:NTP transferase domain-containing protein [Candidatus Methylomirabilis oxyfera]
MMRNVVACILAGGEGRRLLPITAHRAKPAVRFGGCYRLIDFPLSNCVNSGIRKVLVLSPSQSLSLERHLQEGWTSLCPRGDEYVLSIPPPNRTGLISYQGTADAVYQNLSTLGRIGPEHVLILASDHVYHMDYRRLFDVHLEHGADATVATFPVTRETAHQFGIVTTTRRGRVTSFLEKPKDAGALPGGAPSVMASMGIYLFRFDVLRDVLLENSRDGFTHDFGGEILPQMVGRYRLVAFPFVKGIDTEPAYWRDVGTIDAYWEAHMDLLDPRPPFRFQHPEWPLHTAITSGTSAAFIAVQDLGNGQEWRDTRALIAKGCSLSGAFVDRSILSPGVCIDPEAVVEESILFDGVRIGRGAKVRRAILDRGTTVPAGARIGYGSVADGKGFHLSERGVTVVGYTPTGRDFGKETGAVFPHRPPEPSPHGNGHSGRRRAVYASGDLATHLA